MNKILPIVLAVSLALNVYFVASGGLSRNSQERVAGAQPTTLQSPNQDPPEAAAKSSTAIAGPTAVPDDKTSKKKKPSFSKMMENPMMKSEMKRQVRAQLSLEYGEILADQGFTGDEAEALIDILVERQQAISEVALKAIKADASERTALSAEAKAVRGSYDETLAALVGEEAHAELERFDETAGERRLIDSLSNQLATTTEPITPTQEQQLMDLMWEVRQDPNFGGRLPGDIKALSLGTEFPTDPDALLEGIAGLQDEVFTRASFLTPAQAEALQENQEGVLDLLRYQIGFGGHGE